MKNIYNEGRSILRITAILFLLTMGASPQVLAHDPAQRIKELEDQLRTMESGMEAMQRGMQTMQRELESMKSQSSHVTQKIEAIEQRKLEVRPVTLAREKNKNNMIFFRGGFGHSAHLRNGLTFQSNVVTAGAQDRPDSDAWYFGAGFDWNLTNDVWGMLPRTSVLAELMFEYKEFSSGVRGNAFANAPSQLVGGGLNPRKVTVTQVS